MTGPEHYQEAERVLERVATWTHGDPSPLIAEAQVHATLALAAATAQAASLPQIRTACDPESEDGERIVGNPWFQAVMTK